MKVAGNPSDKAARRGFTVLFSRSSYASSAPADYGKMRFQKGRTSTKKRKADGIDKSFAEIT